MLSSGWGSSASKNSRSNPGWSRGPQSDKNSDRGWGEKDSRPSWNRGRDRDEAGPTYNRNKDRGGPSFRRDSQFGQKGEAQTQDEIWERRKEQQVLQAERQSWLQVQNEKFPNSQYLFGVSPVLAALRMQRRPSHTLYIQQSMILDKRKDRDAVDEVERLASQAGCEVVRTDKGRLNVMSENRPHQGLVLQCGPLDFVPLQRLDEAPPAAAGAPPPVWLVLDEVVDPQNLGALLRSAVFLGVEGVAVCAKNSAALTPAVSKASAGAMELMPVHAVGNLMRFLDAARGAGWRVVGAAMAPAAVAAATLPRDLPTLLVLGNEGKGLRTNVMRCCDVLVRIQGRRPAGAAADADAGGGAEEDAAGVEEEEDDGLDSLNVSVAGGILLHRLLAP